MKRRDIQTIARILNRACSDDTLARLVNDLLCCDANPALTDDEANAGARLFDAITDERPDIIEKAQDL